MSAKPLSILWQITPPDSYAPSYLFGTMHVRDQRAFGLLPKLYERIDSCEAFVSELRLDELPALPKASLFQLPPGKLLSDYYRPKQLMKMRQIFLKSMQLDLLQFIAFKPLVFINTISETILSKDMPLSLDAQLSEYAQAQEKQLIGLESMEEQLEYLQKISLENQLRSLAWISRHISAFRRSLIRLAEIYQTGDLRRIHKSSKGGARGMRRIMIYERNYIMADRLASLLPQTSCFVAIGAGHLAGQKGVLRLLKKKGFKIKEVSL